ncbi:23S ribosomal RNA methyltransferase Erm [Shimazuella kribbensis]|uniref:23S ribosomal RNA methyltransferase Erm n=1 Tax=Shimazuella kribbensis TaxID=139808 RepID=UPI0004027C23|nr:23S ribosomal RNA methyltransferase Erm [Shimazuella kribbensis]
MPKNRKSIRQNLSKQAHTGQHFLHNKRMIEEVIATAKIKSDETILEIGAGLGALTLPIAENAGKVIAMENDPNLIPKLKEKINDRNNIQVIAQDFLKSTLPRKTFTVVANIPYSITTLILNKLLHSPNNSLDRAILIMEKGAAKRFSQKKQTNPAILKWKMWFEFEIGKTIPSHCFSPPPRVESVIFIIKRRVQPLLSEKYHKAFFSFVSHCLKYPNQSLEGALKGIFTAPQITRLVRNIKIDRYDPVSILNEYQWAAIFQTITQYVPPHRWPR